MSQAKDPTKTTTDVEQKAMEAYYKRVSLQNQVKQIEFKPSDF